MAVQTCDQAITFRNFDYARALEVVQDEEYLDDSDFDEIRLSRKQGEVFQAIDNFQEKVDNNFDISWEDSDILGEFDKHHREKRQGCTIVTGGSACVTTGLNTNFTNVDPTLPGFVASALAAAAILIAANPAPGLTPNNSPAPGTPGGGALPNVNPGNILALVPAGLIPVAVFPPFFPADRTIPAVAVIFREQPCTVAGTDLTNPERSFGFSPRPTLLDRFLKNVRCLGPRLAAKFGKKPAPVSCGFGKKKRDTGFHGYHVQEECGTIEDCFDNHQPCPRFGAVVKVTFTRGKSSYGSGYGLTERQTGEGFKSAAPPDCRVTG